MRGGPGTPWRAVYSALVIDQREIGTDGTAAEILLQ
jgi:hypothetical protein